MALRRILNAPERHHYAESKDWGQIEMDILADLLSRTETVSRDALLESLAHNIAKKKELGERVGRWAMYAARAFGLQGIVPSDREAEVLLAALATVGDRRHHIEAPVVLIQNETKGPRFYERGTRVLPADGLYRLVPVVEDEAV